MVFKKRTLVIGFVSCLCAAVLMVVMSAGRAFAGDFFFSGWSVAPVASDVVDDKPLLSPSSYGVMFRATHRCNSLARVDESMGAWGVEVDVRESTDTGDVLIWHDEDHADFSGLYLKAFLSLCSARGQVAILDMSHGSDAAAVVAAVDAAGMFDHTRFQVSTIEEARELVDLDGRCLVWLLNGSGTDGETVRVDELCEGCDAIVGVNICGKVVADNVFEMSMLIHGIPGRTGAPLEMCLFAYGNRSDVYGLDDVCAASGVDVLMTDFLP